MRSGLRLTWDSFGSAGVPDEHGEYRLRQNLERLPATYTHQALKAQ